MPAHRRLARLLNLALIVILLAGAFGLHPANAQVDPPTGKPTPGPEGLTYAYNPDNGRLAFVSGSADAPLIAPDQMLGALADVDAGALALAQYGEAFGIANPTEELRLERVDDHAGGATLRYQQQYDGIPVLGGELLLNRDALGQVLSLNGEVSPGLRLPSTHPAVSAARARNTAIAGMKSWYRLSARQVQAAEPELWIYDPAIFGPTDAKPVLVWRVAVRAAGGSAPVDELVLVNAATGRVALHFNQINASLTAQEEPQDPPPTTQPLVEETQAAEPTAEPVEIEPVEPLPEEAQDQVDAALQAQGVENGLYISPDGDDQPGGAANDCRDPAAPCRTIAHAYELAEAGATILAQSGPYEGNLTIFKNLNLSGGWDSTYTSQRGQSAIISDGYWADYGLAIMMNVTVEIRNFTVSGTTDRYAVHNRGNLNISNCVLTNNAGALLSEELGSLTVTNCVISNNHTGLYISYQNSVTISNTTIADNKGYGLRLFFLDTTSAVIRGSIVARNGTRSKFIRGRLVSGGYNIFDLDRPFYDERNIDKGVFVTDSTDQMGVDPQISALIDNRHHALAATSPAIDALGAQIPCPSMDIRGIDRPVNGICDIGAFEYQPAGPVERLLPVPAPAFVTAPDMQFPYLTEVTAVDALGNLAQGVPVTFTAPDSGASAVLVKSTTPHTVSVSSGADGVARPPLLLANSIFGSYTLSATAEGVAPVDFTLGNGTPARYVDPELGDDGEYRNMCLDPAAPCRSLEQALSAANPNDLIMLASGVYTQVTAWYNIAYVQEDIVLSGGWNSSFTQRSGRSQLSGGTATAGIEIEKDVYALVDRVDVVDNNWGLVMQKGQVIWTNSQVKNNYGGIGNYAVLRMENVSITHNQMGIRNAGDLQLTNATISHNICHEGNIMTHTCPSNTAGLENVKQATATLTHVTIADNRMMIRNTDDYWWPEVAGGIDNPSGTVNLRSSIVAFNQNNRGADCQGTINSLGNNIIGIASACTVTPADGDIIGSRENPFNPLLGRVGDYGGETLTVPLLSASPALDSAGAETCPELDQRGSARPAGAGCDRGAYEGNMEGGPLLTAVTTTAEDEPIFPNKLLCESPQVDCTGGVIPDADSAHQYALEVMQMFFDRYGRVSFDNAGAPVMSTVQSTYYLDNAFWSGRQLVYSPGFVADDVAAHEFTHAVMQYTTHLLNYYQSGAINESLADIWGEYYDQTNTSGNDSAAVRWLIGEDVKVGALRNMSDPTRFKQPDKMSSKYYWKSGKDNGGVHANSGINNKAVFLMVDGGRFGTVTVRPIGWEKTLDIYWYAANHLLTSGAGYDDLYLAVNQSCAVQRGGASGITTEDCLEVRKALNAVQMSQSHIRGFNPEATACPTGMKPDPEALFFDDFENGSGQWTFGAVTGDSRWSITPGDLRFYYAASGKYALYGSDFDFNRTDDDQVSDTYAMPAEAIQIPSVGTTVLYFNHAYGFENFVIRKMYYYLDGAVLEYSVDDGLTWKDAKPFYKSGQNYNGSLYNGAYAGNNPLHGRPAFRGESHGYVSTRYDFRSLAGKSVRLRWRMGTDYSGAWLGWVVDDVAVYTCVGKPYIPSLTAPPNYAIISNYQPKLDWKDAMYAVRYDLQVASDSRFTSLLYDEKGLTTSEFTLPAALAANSRYYWHVRSINAPGDISGWSAVKSFRTAIVTPTLEAPADGSTTATNRPVFQWSAPSGATSYSIQVSKYANFQSSLISSTVKTNSYTATKSLAAGTTYYWRVRANGANPSAWSAGVMFHVP